MAACRAAGVPFKATAGLHHPLRAEQALTYAEGSPRGVMHGFLNVFGAAALLRAGAPADEALALLREQRPEALRFRPASIGTAATCPPRRFGPRASWPWGPRADLVLVPQGSVRSAVSSRRRTRATSARRGPGSGMPSRGASSARMVRFERTAWRSSGRN